MRKSLETPSPSIPDIIFHPGLDGWEWAVSSASPNMGITIHISGEALQFKCGVPMGQMLADEHIAAVEACIFV